MREWIALRSGTEASQLKITVSSLKGLETAEALANAKEDALTMSIDESVDGLVDASMQTVTKKLETKLN